MAAGWSEVSAGRVAGAQRLHGPTRRRTRRTARSWCSRPYSPKFLEGGFSEVRIAPVRSRGYWTGAERLRTLREYAPRRSSDPMALQEVLFPYLDALSRQVLADAYPKAPTTSGQSESGFRMCHQTPPS